MHGFYQVEKATSGELEVWEIVYYEDDARAVLIATCYSRLEADRITDLLQENRS